jgi:HK97 family phage major capsid protein
MRNEELKAAIGAAERARSTVFIECSNVDAAIAASGDDDGTLAEKRATLNGNVERLDGELADLREQVAADSAARARVLAAYGNPANEERGDGSGMTEERHAHKRDASPSVTAALRVIERNADAFATGSGDVIERLVRTEDARGIGARYLTATGSEAYAEAFGKLLLDPTHGHLRLTAEEVDAVRAVSAIQAERAMNEGTPGDGGFAIPAFLDPTVIAAGAGAQSPIRALATVTTVSSSVWKGVSSTGVVASYDAESAEVSDDTPALLQPTVYVETARGFIPFSIEVGMDWPGLQAELAAMLADSKDVLEAEKFLDGAGHASQEPSGILTGITSIDTAGSGAFALADCYSLVQAVPSRFQPNATVLGAPAVFDSAYRFVGGGSAEPAILPTREGPFLGRRKAEWSTMSVLTTTAGAKILIAGDVKAGFRIVDRIGMSIELVPHLFATANNRPSGQRGVFAFWRNGSGLVIPAALTQLSVKA